MVPDSAVLTCKVVWSVGRQAVDHLTAGGRAVRYLRLETRGGDQRALVTVTATGWSMNLEGETLFGSGVTLVDDGATITCLSQRGRERLSFERERVPSLGFERPVVAAAQPRLEGAVLPDGRPGVTIVVELDEVGTGARYRHRLVVDPQEPAGGLGVRLLDLLLGSAAVHAASGYPFEAVAALVGQTGTPVAGSVELISADDEPLGQVGGFRIEELRRADGEPDLLAGCEDFQDLRGGERAASLAARMQAGDAPLDLPSLPVRSAPYTAAASIPLLAQDAGTGVGGAAAPEPPPTGPQRRANGGQEPEEPSDERPSGSSGPGTTTTASFGLLLQQRLLTDISSNVNHLLGPLAGATFAVAGGGRITIDWLASTRSSVRASADPTTGEPAKGLVTLLFCLAHDVHPPADMSRYTGPTIVVPNWGTLSGRGLLDREAMREAKRRLVTGTLTPGTLARLPASASAAVAAAGTDWKKLSNSDRLELAFAVLRATTGTLTIPPAGMKPLPNELPFNADDLVEGELTGYSGTLTLPAAPSSAPGICPLIASLVCRSDGIDGSVRLGSLTLTGTLNRRAGAKYHLVLGLSVIVALAIPALAWIVPLIAGIEAFILLDSATATASASGLGADFQVRFVADNSHILKTQVSVTVSGTTSVSLSSNVPTGLHQVVDLVIASLANAFSDEVLNAINAALGSMLTEMVERSFGRGFPAGLFRKGVPVAGSSITGQNNDHLYMEAMLQAPTGATVVAVSVPAAGRTLARQDSQRLMTLTPKRRHYLSLVSSQNTLNVLLAAAWARGEFNAALQPDPSQGASATTKGLRPPPIGLPATLLGTLRALAPSPYPAGAPIIAASLIATAPPRLTLTQAVPVGATQHGLLEMFMALSLQPDKNRRYEWTIRFTAPAWLVVGSASASAKPKIELLTAYQQPIEVLVDLAYTTAQVSAVHAVEFKTRTVTETVNTNGTFDTWSYKEEYEIDTPYALSGAAAQLPEPLALLAVRQALQGRDLRRAPVRDGIRADGSLAGAPDPVTLLHYQLDGTDPDGTDAAHPPSKAAFVLADLSFSKGLLFHHLSLAGDAAGMLDPANLDLQTRDVAGKVLDAIGDPNLDPKTD